MAKDKVKRAENLTEKINHQQNEVEHAAGEHDQARPEKPGWYKFAGKIYNQAIQKWEQAREHISDWMQGRLQTFGKRLERVKPYLNFEFSLSKATEQIDKQDPDMAKLYEEHKAAKEKERQQREQAIREKLEKEQQEKKQAYEAGKQAELNRQQLRKKEILKKLNKERGKDQSLNEKGQAARERQLETGANQEGGTTERNR